MLTLFFPNCSTSVEYAISIFIWIHFIGEKKNEKMEENTYKCTMHIRVPKYCSNLFFHFSLSYSSLATLFGCREKNE